MDEIASLIEKLDLNPDLIINTLKPHPLHIQKCYLSTSIFNKLSLKPGGYVCIKCNTKIIICKVYPKILLPENIIEADVSVSIPVAETFSSECTNLKLECAPNIISLLEIDVTIIFEDYKFMSIWNGKDKELHDVLKKNILTQFIVADRCEISLENLSLVKRMGINKIIVSFNTENVQNIILGAVNSKTKLNITAKMTQDQFNMQNTTLTKIYTMDHILARLINIIEVNESFSKTSESVLIQPSKQALIVGPSGCGKSSIVKLAAQRTKSPLISIFGHDVNHREPGETEATLRELFDQAFQCAKNSGKCIINLDEINNLCPKRKNSSSHMQRSVTQLLLLLDKAQTVPGIIIFATTNKPEHLDPSLRRHGRLETEIYIGPPTEMQRSLIFRNLIAESKLNIPLDNMDELCQTIAAMSPGYVGADIKLICQRIHLKIITKKIIQEGNDLNFWINEFRNIISNMTPVSLKGTIGIVVTTRTSFDDIAGIDDIKRTLEVAILWPIKHPEAFIRMGIKRPRGILLYGPPGCAKTSLLKALACLGTLSLLTISAAELYSPYVGDAERLIMQLFQRARQNSPCILFIDEIDALAGSRGDTSEKSSDVQDRILAALLTQMDGVGTQKLAADWTNQSNADDGVIVIGATNRPDMLDAALLRPGRFDRHILVPPPSPDGRLEILKLVTRKMPVADDLDLAAIAAATNYFSGADLKSICTEAGLIALSEDGMDVNVIKQSHFQKALSRARPSLSPASIAKYYNFHNKT